MGDVGNLIPVFVVAVPEFGFSIPPDDPVAVGRPPFQAGGGEGVGGGGRSRFRRGQCHIVDLLLSGLTAAWGREGLIPGRLFWFLRCRGPGRPNS